MSSRNDADTISRREFLKRGFGIMAGAALFHLCGNLAWPLRALGETSETKARARSVIQIWMWGGPSHLDTFDPKPSAGRDYCGPLDKDIPTNVSGIRINAALPLLAAHADKYSIIRSMTHGINAHETASYVMQTGRQPGGRLVYPCMGAVVSFFKGYDHGYKGLIPPYIVLTQPQGRFSEAGFLGPKYKPFATGGNPAQKRFEVSGIVAEGFTDKRQEERRALLHSLDSLGQAMPENGAFKKMDECEENAYSLILGEERKVFDLSLEDEKLRDKYGRNTFGQSCLAARRLVERGVPWVTINYRGWDSHKQHFESMRRNLPELDAGMSALLGDLKERGLLDSTIVLWGGEFGRSPRVQWEAPWNGGRTHYGKCFTWVVAGGGFKGGRIVGASDARGEEVAGRPVYPRDLIGSVYELMGIDPEGPLPNPHGEDIKVMPATGDGGRLKEIM
ncbi:MAG TPA: DUF1501 domain-containing protein [Candidatus Sumerlaeota bacterium]|nr:DUF1501 domain-containing protein [Candidatus Sumerlaeota bacterium]